MYKNILTVVGITILFLGLAIQPSIAIVQLEKIDSEANVDDVEGLVAQLRDAVNGKLEKFESIPKVANIWEIILNLLEFIVYKVKNFINIIFNIFLIIWS